MYVRSPTCVCAFLRAYVCVCVLFSRAHVPFFSRTFPRSNHHALRASWSSWSSSFRVVVACCFGALKGYGLPPLDGKQQASLARALQVHTVRRGLGKHSSGGNIGGGGGGGGVQVVQRGDECAHVRGEEEGCDHGQERV